MAGRNIVVQDRRPADDFWMVWDEHGMIGSVRSLTELRALLTQHGATLGDVHWEGNARASLERAHGLPPEVP
jgi:hypothetical protein